VRGFDFQGPGHTHPRFYGYLASHVATNGSTYVDLPMTELTKVDMTHSAASAEITVDLAGDYIFHVSVVSDYNIFGSIMYASITTDTGGGYSILPKTEKIHHTAAVRASEVMYSVGPYSVNAGDKFKLQAKFNAADAGSNFLANRCTLGIFGVVG
jgi:hypothetical protein